MRNKRRRYKKREKRVSFSPDEMLDYLRSHDFRTAKRLMDGRSKGDPNEYDYRKEFGTWRNAKEAAFGKDIQTGYDPYYIAAVIVTFNLRSASLYRASRAENPGHVPPMRTVLMEFGSWQNAAVTARRHDENLLITEYGELAVKLGRKPRVPECEAIGIDAKTAVKIYDSDKIYDMVLQRESIRARQKRNSTEV